MTDTAEETVINDQLVLICGESGTGKSASLIDLPDHERVMYLNCESGKRLPFKNQFQTFTITDPFEVYDGFDFAQDNPDFDFVVTDTITFLMDMFESNYVVNAANTMDAWGQFAQFFKNLMQDKVAKSDKSVIMLAHTLSELDESSMEMRTKVPIKGSVKSNGVEAYFSTVVAAKKVDLKKLEGYENDLLTITEDDELLGYKHVFQTRLTKETRGERIRSPMGMFTVAQTYMDNNAALLMKHMQEYYED